MSAEAIRKLLSRNDSVSPKDGAELLHSGVMPCGTIIGYVVRDLPSRGATLLARNDGVSPKDGTAMFNFGSVRMGTELQHGLSGILGDARTDQKKMGGTS